MNSAELDAAVRRHLRLQALQEQLERGMQSLSGMAPALLDGGETSTVLVERTLPLPGGERLRLRVSLERLP